jgi:hypothetical protein
MEFGGLDIGIDAVLPLGPLRHNLLPEPKDDEMIDNRLAYVVRRGRST